MRVLAHDIRPIEPTRDAVAMVDLNTLLAESDVLSVHIHLTDETYHFLDRTMFAKMKPGAILINTSRGAVIDQEALIEALADGRLGGAGVDVLEGEWDGDLAEHPVVRYAREHDNLVITPHIAGACVDAQGKTARYTSEKLARMLGETTGCQSHC